MKTAFFTHVAMAAFALGPHAHGLAQESKPEYAIKEDAPRTGSSILRNAVTMRLPLNRRYNELSAEDRAMLHQAWEGIPDGDEPPFPSKGLRPIYKAVIDAQAKLGVEGELHLSATVDARGDVVEVKAYGSPSPEMTQFAATVILKTKFKPAVCAGQPCRMDFPFRYKFVLEP